MMKLKDTLLTMGLAASTTLFFAGCSEGDQASHDHDHAEHAHAEAEGQAGDTDGAADTDGVAAVAGKLAEAAGTMAIIENPTEEQLKGTKAYPLDTCLVSGEELGSMGDPLVFLVGDQQVKLCCEHCVSDLKKDTAKLMAKLSE